MSPQTITELVQRKTPALPHDRPLGWAIEQLLRSDLPALPVSGRDGRYLGIFGEREFIAALFPAYLGHLSSAAFLPAALEQVIEKRHSCLGEPVGDHTNTEHVDVPPSFSDVQLAETFLHHRVLVVPIVENGVVVGIITRSAFVRVLAQRLSPTSEEPQ